MPRNPTFRKGQTFGPNELDRFLDHGGNAEVWTTSGGAKGRVAIKILYARDAEGEPYQRFRREVEQQRRLGQVRGVLPLWDAHLPERLSRNERAWLLMPIAEPIRDALGDSPTIENVVEAVAAVAETLAELAERGVAHRDVKPENLYRWKGRWVIGDFGLIDAPGVDPLTVGARALGPRHYLAPEMVLDPAGADGAAADVYSLGKTLWALLTGQAIPPLGQHGRGTEGKRLGDWGVEHPRAFYLDRLIEQMTREIPKERAPMSAVASTLRSWLEGAETHAEFSEPGEVGLEDIAESVAEVFQRDSAAARPRQERTEAVNAVVDTLVDPVRDFVAELMNKRGIPIEAWNGSDTALSHLVLSDVAQELPMTDRVAASRTCLITRNTGYGTPAFLRSGFAAALAADDQLAMVAAHALLGGQEPQIIWSDAAVVLRGSEIHESAGNRLVDGWRKHFGAALTAFVTQVGN